jgi:hypothetical protein
MSLPWRIILVSSFVIVLLHVWAALQPSHYNWGIHYFAFYDLWISLSAFVCAMLLFVPSVQSFVLSRLASLTRSVSRMSALLVIVILTGLWISVLLAFAVQGHMLGDSALIIQLTPQLPSIEDATSNFRNQPLTYLFLRLLQMVIGGGAAVEPAHLYVVADLIGGVLFLILTIGFVNTLKISTLDKTLLSLLFVFGAGNQMFFGYVENYVFFYVCVSAYLISGWLALEGKLSVVVPLVCFAFMVGLHLGGAIFSPTLLPLIVPVWRKHRIRAIVFPCLVVASAVVLLGISGYTPGVIQQRVSDALRNDFLPITNSSGVIPYGIFSGLHLVDWGNALLHVAPIEFIMIIVLLIALRNQIAWRSPLIMFLLMATSCGLLFTFVMNPALGMARDWDLLASFFVPLRFLLVYLLLQTIDYHHVRQILVLILCISFLHWASWIGVNANEDRHLRRAELLTTPVLSGTFPKIYFEQLGSIMFRRQEYERARQWYEKYFELDPFNPRLAGNLAQTYRELGETEKRFEMLQRAAVNSRDPGVYSNIGAEFIDRKDTITAIKYLHKSLDIDSNYSVAHANLALLYTSLKNYPLAGYHAERAILLGMKEPVLFNIAKAVAYYEVYVKHVPNDVAVVRMLELLRTLQQKSHSGKK